MMATDGCWTLRFVQRELKDLHFGGVAFEKDYSNPRRG
jgi:hypothetical protein